MLKIKQIGSAWLSVMLILSFLTLPVLTLPVLTLSVLTLSVFTVSVLSLPAPATAALFGNFGLKDEMDMGRKFAVLVKSSLPLVEDPEVKLYVQGLVDTIVAQLPPQPYKFPANVILDSSLNAFASPGGFVFVHTGLLQNLENESELAGVFSHEIAHVTQRHIAGRMERGQLISIASMLAAIAGAALGGGGDGSGAAMTAAAAAGQAAMLNYSRVDENEADLFGLQYLIAAGYNPRGLNGAFSKIQAQSWGAGAMIPEYLSTHPDMGSRLSNLEARVRSLPPAVQERKNDNTRLRRVQALLWARYGDMQHAAQMLKRSDSAINYMGLGILAGRQSKVREAEEFFQKALALSPNDALILREAGTFHYDKGDLDLARKQLEQALALNAKDYLGRFYYARLLDDFKQPQAAQEAYRNVLSYVPEDAEVHTYYGRSLGQSGKTFEGYLHLAYAALYSNDQRKTANSFKQAKSFAKNPEQENEVKRFEQALAERQQYW